MSIEERLKALILDRYGNVVAFSKATGIPNTTIASILKRGIMNSSIDNFTSICKALNISADELANGRIVNASNQNAQIEFTDIETTIEYARLNPDEYSKLSINGKPLSEDEFRTITTALEVAVGIIKHNRKH